MNFDFTRIDVVDFLEELGIDNVQDKGDEVFYSCPFPGHSNRDNNPSASMKQGSTVAYCFTCGWKGNALRFLSDYEGVNPIQALKFLRERFGDDFKEPETTVADEINQILAKKDDEVHEIRVLDDKECERRLVNWKEVEKCYGVGSPRGIEIPLPFHYMIERGFSADVLTEFEIGYDTISERITIPYRLPMGQLIGFKARAYKQGQNPRYMVLGGAEYGFEPFKVGDTLFGLPQAMKSDAWQTREHLYVCEGELNCIAMHDKGYQNTVGISGKYLSDTQVGQLVGFAASATFIFDEFSDSIRAATRLEPYMPVAVAPDRSYDPAEASEDELRELIQGCASLMSCRLPSYV